jgi:hypothetical protein
LRKTKAILTRVSGVNPHPINQEAAYLVSGQLIRGMADREVELATEYLCSLDDDLSEEDIQNEVLSKRDDVLECLAQELDGWRKADWNLTAANERLELGVSKSKLASIFTIGMVGIGASFSLSIVLADLVYRGFLIGGIAIAGVLAAWIYASYRNLAIRKRNLSLDSLERALETAEKRFKFAATNQATVAIRETINERLTSFSAEFRLLDERGLRAMADPEREVSTTASEDLSTLIASLSSGSIGLSGPRGIGKTTLIGSFAEGKSVPLERDRVGLVVSAPVKYDAKEFVLHLFASLCESVLGDDRLSNLRYASLASIRERRRSQLTRVAGAVWVALAGAGVAMLAFDQTRPQGPKQTGYFLLIIATVVAFVWLELWIQLRSTRYGRLGKLLARLGGRDPSLDPDQTPVRTAQDHLEQIRFQQSISSSRSGSIKLPLGIGLSGDSSVTMARTPWSLPEAVEAFRKYAASLTEDHYLVIGIDELDKMGSDDNAREFLNNIKGVFGVSGCYYLVSISDDAMAGFERRGLPVRDVFDSSFDAVQRVDYLTLDESRAVLGSRVIGLPVPYQCLCHCMAGGLPRDLIRVTRELVHQEKRNKATSLGGLCHAVVEAELRAKMAGALEVSRETGGEGSEWVQKWLDEQAAVETGVDWLQGSVAGLASWNGLREDIKPSAAAELAFEVGTFNYYAATLLELFTDDSEFIDFLRADPESTEVSPTAIGVLEMLTKARQQFAIGPGLAWESIEAARDRQNLPVWNDPRTVEEMNFG